MLQRQAGETKVEELEDNLCKKRKELMGLQEEAKELELEIEDYTKKINQRCVGYRSVDLWNTSRPFVISGF